MIQIFVIIEWYLFDEIVGEDKNETTRITSRCNGGRKIGMDSKVWT